MSILPIFLKPHHQQVLVVGSTSDAMAKLALLAEIEAPLILVGTGIKAALTRAGLSTVTTLDAIHDRPFQRSDLDGITLVYAATGDDAEERAIFAAAKSRGIPVNIVDRPELCSFITPAQFRRGPISVAYSSEGKAPVFTRRLRADLERLLPAVLGRLATAVGSLREDLKTIIPNKTARRQFWDTLFDSADCYADAPEKDIPALIVKAAHQHDKGPTGRVQLVGAGPGDPDLLTLKAHRALQQADVILYDNLVSNAVLSLARRDAERIYVGKQAGNHGLGQQGITDLMVHHARLGRRVVRLKQGDPLLFARAGEELDAVREAAIPLDIIPGVTALSGIAATSQIPLTDRRWASSLTLVTGHTKDGSYDDWARLAGKGQTLAVYMGLKASPKIAEGLIAQGLSPHLPVALIEKGTQADERRFFTTLATLPQTVKLHAVQSPALIIIGDVVRAAKDGALDTMADTIADRVAGGVTTQQFALTA